MPHHRIAPGSVSVKDLLGAAGIEPPVGHRADTTGRFKVAAGAAVATGALLGSVAQLTPAAAVAEPLPPTDQGAENPLDAGLRWLSSLVPPPAPAPAPVLAEEPAPQPEYPEPAPTVAPAAAPFGFANLPPQIAGPLAQAEQIIKDLQQQATPLAPAQAAPAAPAVLPVAGQISSEFGSRWGGFHYGVDIAEPLGTPIQSAMGGTVLEAGPASGFGQWVRVQQDDGTIAVYGHVNDFYVQPGQRVDAGDVIASVGNRGQSTGPHLHLEIWDQAGNKIDPVAWLADKGVLTEEHWDDHRH
ncbi:M23 family metallopeptidase [Nocardia sp. NPDC051832]|uniref:M23 family metallopeptidase n=1 Tax=Nocardia sp. NPDC051832 TaxID=3155673 RepID=UPI00342FB4F1